MEQKKSSNHKDWTCLVQESQDSRCAVEVVDDTAILWSRISLRAFVRGDGVVTESTVTEVFRKQGNDWKVLALTFSSVRDKHQIKHCICFNWRA